MADKPKSSVECRDWPGLVTQADRRDVPPGAGVYQINVQSERPGELRVRRGLTVVLFDSTLLVSLSDSVTITEDVVAFRLNVPISKENTVTVTESISRLLSAFVNVSDTVTITETVSAVVS